MSDNPFFDRARVDEIASSIATAMSEEFDGSLTAVVHAALALQAPGETEAERRATAWELLSVVLADVWDRAVDNAAAVVDDIARDENPYVAAVKAGAA